MSKVEMLRCVLREKHSCAEANGISVTPPPTSSWQESVHRVSVGVGVGSNHRVALTASILNQGQ